MSLRFQKCFHVEEGKWEGTSGGLAENYFCLTHVTVAFSIIKQAFLIKSSIKSLHI